MSNVQKMHIAFLIDFPLSKHAPAKQETCTCEAGKSCQSCHPVKKNILSIRAIRAHMRLRSRTSVAFSILSIRAIREIGSPPSPPHKNPKILSSCQKKILYIRAIRAIRVTASPAGTVSPSPRPPASPRARKPHRESRSRRASTKAAAPLPPPPRDRCSGGHHGICRGRTAS